MYTTYHSRKQRNYRENVLKFTERKELLQIAERKWMINDDVEDENDDEKDGDEKAICGCNEGFKLKEDQKTCAESK